VLKRLAAVGLRTVPAASRCMNSSGLITRCVVPSRHGCVVVTSLFVIACFATDLKAAVGLLLIGAVPSLVAGLACFLRPAQGDSGHARRARIDDAAARLSGGGAGGLKSVRGVPKASKHPLAAERQNA
jgi:hypothetical protein